MAHFLWLITGYSGLYGLAEANHRSSGTASNKQLLRTNLHARWQFPTDFITQFFNRNTMR
jgi:hypothetical protein